MLSSAKKTLMLSYGKQPTMLSNAKQPLINGKQRTMPAKTATKSWKVFKVDLNQQTYQSYWHSGGKKQLDKK